MIFSWLDATAAQQFGSELAQSFIASMPSAGAVSDKKFEAKAKTAVAQFERSIAAFRRDHRLNFYQKARLGNAFKWALKDAGYDAAYIEKITDLLMLKLQ
jgi:hypothetical protein